MAERSINPGALRAARLTLRTRPASHGHSHGHILHVDGVAVGELRLWWLDTRVGDEVDQDSKDAAALVAEVERRLAMGQEWGTAEEDGQK